MNSLVGIKPTVGLISRTGIIPISYNQDTAGPMAKNVADASTILAVLMGHDIEDTSTKVLAKNFHQKFLGPLNPKALQGQRIGVVRNFARFQESVDKVFEDALAVIQSAGAEVIDGIALPDQQTIREHEIVVLRTEFKVALNAYLSGLPDQTRVRSLSELIHFNEQNRLEVMPYFQQEQLLAAEATHGLDDLKYKKALGECQRLSRREGIDKALSDYSCSALVAPTSSTPWAIDLINGDNRLGGSSCLAAVSGYPSVTLPMGYITGLPVGLSFIGKAWHDLFIINLAYAFEQASLVRYPPGGSAQLLQ
jgi:amidase